jgi:hypothetical protein
MEIIMTLALYPIFSMLVGSFNNLEGAEAER